VNGRFWMCDWQILDVCGDRLADGTYDDDPRCSRLLGQMQAEMGGFNVYNVYDPCYLRNDEALEAHFGALRASSQRLVRTQ
jgi:hypothetical protein